MLLQQNLRLSGKDSQWVQSALREKNAKQEDTFLLALLGTQVIFIPKEES